jgi:peroxiredoxin
MDTKSRKLAAGAPLPDLAWPRVGGGDVAPARGAGWRLLVVYRGKHCPLCKKYFKTLDGLLDQFAAAGIAVSAVSADPAEKAAADVAEQGWRFPVGYGMSLADMAALGLYVSAPRSPQETDRPFAEPGLFLVNPEGRVQIVDISNAPFARPDLAVILSGAKFVIEKGYPVRGAMA